MPDDDTPTAALRRRHDDFPDDELSVSVSDFYDDLLTNPEYAASTARFKAIVTAYARGDEPDDICSTFGVTRTEVAFVVRSSGVRKGMDSLSMSPEDVANLYALLFAAQLEIESLRRQLKGDDDKN